MKKSWGHCGQCASHKNADKSVHLKHNIGKDYETCAHQNVNAGSHLGLQSQCVSTAAAGLGTSQFCSVYRGQVVMRLPSSGSICRSDESSCSRSRSNEDGHVWQRKSVLRCGWKVTGKIKPPNLSPAIGAEVDQIKDKQEQRTRSSGCHQHLCNCDSQQPHAELSVASIPQASNLRSENIFYFLFKCLHQLKFIYF